MKEFYYALDQNQQVIGITEADNNSEYTCSYCGGRLSIKDGPVKRKHFFHVSGDCPEVDQDNKLLDISNRLKGLSLLEYHQNYQKILSNKYESIKLKKDEIARNIKILSDAVKLIKTHSKPYRNGKFPKNRELNKTVLNDLTSFIKNKGGKIPELDLCRWSGIENFINPYSNYKEIVWPGNAWQYDSLVPAQLYDAYLIVNDRSIDDKFDLECFEALNRISLYFLKITTEGIEYPIYKIGITRRNVLERLKEIKYDLKVFKPKEIDVLYSIKGLGYLESYIKREYKNYVFDFDSHEEYFNFPGEVIQQLNKQLKRVSFLDVDRLKKIKLGMRSNKGGRPKKAEDIQLFLQKTRSKEIIALLKENKGIREINRLTGYSVNTIQKVKKLST